jgi:4-hydroxymandelate oxidase
VGIGRPVLWSLAVDGADGVHDLLTGFAAEVAEALRLVGARSPGEVARDQVMAAPFS